MSQIGGNCFTCQVRQKTEWCVLSEQELEQVNRAKHNRQYLPGDVLFHEGDENRGIHCIQSGLLGVRKYDADGNSMLLRLAHPGETLGYRSFLSGEHHRDSAEVLKQGTICFIERDPIRRILVDNPNLGLRFLQRATRELGDADDRVLRNVTLSVRARFVHLMLVLRDRFGASEENGAVSLELPLSRQDLAAMIGTRPETVSRTVRQLEADGIARFTGRMVHVPVFARLLDEVAPEHEF